jgi:hypothetical protein
MRLHPFFAFAAFLLFAVSSWARPEPSTDIQLLEEDARTAAPDISRLWRRKGGGGKGGKGGKGGSSSSSSGYTSHPIPHPPIIHISHSPTNQQSAGAVPPPPPPAAPHVKDPVSSPASQARATPAVPRRPMHRARALLSGSRLSS